MSDGEIRTARQARQILGLAGSAGPEEASRAFRIAVRAAHPDRGGDPDRLRRVIDARRLLAELESAPLHFPPAVGRPTPPPCEIIQITPQQAALGGDHSLSLPDGRRVRLSLPAGLRRGDKVRLKTPAGDRLFNIRFPAGDLEVRGDNLWMRAAVSPRLLAQGGSITVCGPRGPATVAFGPTPDGRTVVRAVGHGLPARGRHPQGDLFVRLEGDETLLDTPARTLLRRFTAAWAA